MTNEKRKKLARLMQVLLPLLVLTAMITASASIQRREISSHVDAVFVKATVDNVLQDTAHGEPFAGNQRVEATITTGQYRGMQCQLDNTNSYQRGALCLPGTRIIALVSQKADGLKGSVYNYDRTGMVFLLIGLFSVSLIAVGGKKGAASLYALVFTFTCIICLYIPLLYIGVHSITAAVLSAVVILVASIYILNGWSQKTGAAIIGTTIGVAVSGFLVTLMGQISCLSGYNMSDVESMVYIENYTNLDVGGILYAGVLISSLGAVMDVSVSIVAAMQEIHEKSPKLGAKELFVSGMHVGHDMMGTMSNTLILAYTGSATGVLLTVYAYQMPFLQMMGYNSIIIEITCGLCGTIGVILTVPLQAAITAAMLKLVPRTPARKNKTA